MVDLGELADKAITEFKLASGTGGEALQHAIECGGALLEASHNIPANVNFREWLEAETEIATRTAFRYMRLFGHRRLLPADCAGITEAGEILVGAPAIETGKRKRIDPAIIAEAQHLRDCGASWAELSYQFGRSQTAIRGWLDPRVKEREDDRRKARRALEKEKCQALSQVKRLRILVKAGGAYLEATKNGRAAMAFVDSLLASVQDEDQKQALREVRLHWNRGMDKLRDAALIAERR